MAEIISFYSVAPTQGKRTLSMSFSKLLADNDHQVLYIELDTKHPSVAISTRIEHAKYNAVEYFKNTVKRRDFSIESHVLTQRTLLENQDRLLKRTFSELPSTLDYLVLPLDFNEDDFPDLLDGVEDREEAAQQYIEVFLHSLRTSKYDYVILNLPNELNSIFGYEVIARTDKVLNVVTASANRIAENQKAITFLSQNIPNFEEKNTTILNMASDEVNDSEYEQLFSEDVNIIRFDPQRQALEFTLDFGSEAIKSSLESIAFNFGMTLMVETPKRKMFGRW